MSDTTMEFAKYIVERLKQTGVKQVSGGWPSPPPWAPQRTHG